MSADHQELTRRLDLRDAVVIGAGSMIGAGVFAAWAPAAGAAGTTLIVGLVIAGIVAFCNATSSAQLAALHPESGGTYVYGRARLGPAWGHLAGWAFVVGKTASCAAMALTVGAYLWPQQERLAGIVAVLLITAVNLGGLSRTVAVTRVLLVVSLLALAVVVASGWTADGASLRRLAPLDARPLEVLESAGLLFFAFAGYARIATLGEEVKHPERTIPRAVPRALLAVLIVYLVVGVTALAAVPTEVLAGTDAPLRSVVEAGRLDAMSGVVRVGAGIASLGVLLNLVPGVSRTSLAMARRGELPTWFAKVDTERSLPLRAELTVAAVVTLLTAMLDLRGAIGASGVAILTYYAITNAAALRLAPDERRWPRAVAVVGLVGCVTLAVTLPLTAVLIGSGVLASGAAARLLSTRSRRTAAGGHPT